jgi:hypothetical protein
MDIQSQLINIHKDTINTIHKQTLKNAIDSANPDPKKLNAAYYPKKFTD